MKSLDELCINALRFLALDAIEQAGSGHPGIPLGAAPMAYVLWDRFLRHNPRNPFWINRDRFILSAGHGSALLYALLHLYGYDLPLDELKRFRQWGSKTPGHPEYGLTTGVETTTGPLGQGFAMGVGMAMAERFLANCFNLPNFPIVDNYTYSIISDGDLMEGISSEAAYLAGTLHLNKLIYLYDDNHISIEGETDITFTENVLQRFETYGWFVLQVADGNNLLEIDKVIRRAKDEKKKPTLIIVRTQIGYGSPKQNTAVAHGEPLGQKALLETKRALDWPTEPTFYIPEETLNHFHLAIAKGDNLEIEWNNLLDDYRHEAPDLASQFEQVIKGELPVNWKSFIPSFKPKEGPMATRNASGKVMNVLSEKLHSLGGAPHHFLIGGSADLDPSTKTILTGYGDFGFSKDCAHNIHFGVREHAMGAIANGMALYSNYIPYTATFLVFSDYMRPAIRLAALMQTHVIFIFTHDSIGLGEDGPTHQPVEHLMSLRAIPGLTVIRPADANETAVAWEVAVERKGPVSLILSHQDLSVLDPEHYPIKEGVPRGAYILAESDSGNPDITLIATGSEVHLALDSSVELKKKGLNVQVVSMPSWELFEEQPIEYKKHVLQPDVPKLALEAGVTIGWPNYVGEMGVVIGLDRFGASAPSDIVYDKLGFNVDNVVKHALELVRR
ncbi:MAG: transketolase [Candidatus Methylarchaceae archaeon HK02M2]|nr:transketolase [Candidatus Methylarchaceae archaeon HK02M2]